MKMHFRSLISANVFSLALIVGAVGCSSDPSTGGGGTGGSNSGTGGSSSTGGSGGSSSGTGGSGSGTGGSATGTGGSATGTGGSASGTGGASATGGTPGTGGSTSTGGTGGTSSDAGGDTAGGDTGGTPGAFTLTSPDFLMISNNRLCHKKEQTSSGSQTSPALMWTGLPPEAKSIAVSLKDRNGGTHWVMWDIPITVTGLPGDINKAMKPEGSKNSGNWYGPGAGLPHRTYEYRVWAMKEATLPGGCAGKACYPNALMTNSIAFKELLVVGTASGTCPN